MINETWPLPSRIFQPVEYINKWRGNCISMWWVQWWDKHRGPGSLQEASHPILDASWIKELGWGNLARNSWLGGEFQVVQRPRDTKYIKLHAKIFILFYVALSFLRPAVGMIAFVFVLCVKFYVITSIIVSKIVISIFLGVAFVIHSLKWLHIPSLLIIITIYLNFEWS